MNGFLAVNLFSKKPHSRCLIESRHLPLRFIIEKHHEFLEALGIHRTQVLDCKTKQKS